MLLHEYETLMGNSCTEEMFNSKVNPLYMMTDLDKEAFCDDYKLHGHSKILDEVLEHALHVERQYTAALQEIDKLLEKLTFAAEHLAIVADDCGSEDSYKIAVDLAGQNYITKFKIRENIDLNEQDKQYILNSLT